MFIWKFKMNLPSEGLLIVCSKISVISYFGMGLGGWEGVCWCSIPPPFLVGDRGCWFFPNWFGGQIHFTHSYYLYHIDQSKCHEIHCGKIICLISLVIWMFYKEFSLMEREDSWVCKLSGVWQKWKYCVLGQVII